LFHSVSRRSGVVVYYTTTPCTRTMTVLDETQCAQ